MNETELGRQIVRLAEDIHRSMGGIGLSAAAYQDALTYALTRAGLNVESRTVPPGTYPGVRLTNPTRVDMIVNDQVIVLCRVTRSETDEAQALAQLRITGLKLALIINFGAPTLRGAVRRVTNYD
jgi:GxxExxY protein